MFVKSLNLFLVCALSVFVLTLSSSNNNNRNSQQQQNSKQGMNEENSYVRFFSRMDFMERVLM